MQKPLVIDGSQGEGGGQILRTALSLSMVTGQPFRLFNIRAGREKPGLLRQHLTAVTAAAQVCGARTQGVTIGSKELSFHPGPPQPGTYAFSVGTAGSATLVLQTVLPALLQTSQPSTLRLEGGTHNPFAPPFPFLTQVFLPLLQRMGPTVKAHLERPGFYPAGGGRLEVRIEPAPLMPLTLLHRGAILRRKATAMVAHLPRDVAERELEVLSRALALQRPELSVEINQTSLGPGNVVWLELHSEHLTEVFSAMGERRKRAELVGEEVLTEAQAYLEAEVPVGEHLADQLLLPLALAGGGSFRTMKPSSHTLTNAQTIRRFLEIRVRLEEESERVTVVTVEKE